MQKLNVVYGQPACKVDRALCIMLNIYISGFKLLGLSVYDQMFKRLTTSFHSDLECRSMFSLVKFLCADICGFRSTSLTFKTYKFMTTIFKGLYIKVTVTLNVDPHKHSRVPCPDAIYEFQVSREVYRISSMGY